MHPSSPWEAVLLEAAGISQAPSHAVSVLVVETTRWPRLQQAHWAGANPRFATTGLTPFSHRFAGVTPVCHCCSWATNLAAQGMSSGSWKPKGEAARWGGRFGGLSLTGAPFGFRALQEDHIPSDIFCPIFKNWGCSAGTQLIAPVGLNFWSKTSDITAEMGFSLY